MALQRHGFTRQISQPGERVNIGRVELRSGVGTVLLQQFQRTDAAGTSPFALLRAHVDYGIDGARFGVVADWQLGARIVVPGDYVDLWASYEETESRDPIEISLTAAIIDGAPAPPTPWGFTVRCNELVGPRGSQTIQVPQGAHDVALYAPTAASWGGFIVRQQAAVGGNIIVSDTPITPAPVELLPGCRWIYVENNTGVDLRPLIRFGLA